MSQIQIPKGWELKKLGDCCNVVRGSSPRPKGDLRYFGGKIPWIKISDITASGGKYVFSAKEGLTPEGVLKSRFLKSGTLILTTSMLIAMPKILKMDGCIHDGFLAILEIDKKIDLDFLYYFFLRYRTKIEHENALGSAIKNINTEVIKNLEILIPPLETQKRIVAKVEELFSKLDFIKQSLSDVRVKLKQYRQSLLKSAFEGKLVPQDPDEAPAKILFEKIRSENHYLESDSYDDMKQLPSSWIVTRLGEMIEPSKEKFEPTSKVEKIFIGLEHIESNTGQIIGQGNSMDVKSTKSVFHKGDVLYGKLRPYLNKVSVPNFDGVCSTDILVFPKNDYLESKYLSWFLSRNAFVKFANSTISGVQHPRTNFEKISTYGFPLPPLNEQKRIVAKVEECFSLIQTSEKLVGSLLLQNNSMKNSILKQAFEGKLVPQDPDEAPAKILPVKIKHEKQKNISQAIKPRKKKNDT